MRAHWLVCILAIVCLGALSAAALADETKPAPAAAGQPAGAEESGMQPAPPGPEHAFLAKFSGRWKAAQKMMMDPTRPPMVSEGIEENTMICGGLFLHLQG